MAPRTAAIINSNEDVVEMIGRDVDAFEISEKPYELKAIVEAVRRKLES